MNAPPLAYFGSWDWNTLPLTPREMLSRDEAERRSAFYVARYHDDGRLAVFQKYLHGLPDWSVEYTYWDNGNVKTRLTMTPGQAPVTDTFDRRGRPSPPEGT